ncbi:MULTISPECIES: ABC transporter permease [Amniculibacterium]|uniref:ABC transporter permease n=1 Tax=Amniculibacterium TaxID=2715289 RepID=UPI000F5AB1A3|nr:MULTISPECIES: ABC transporter permease [Amniculibacterium]
MKNTAFYIAQRYLIAKKGSSAVTIITWLAVLAMTFAVTAMFIIISVFSGLEDLNRDIIKNLHADLTIKSSSGKTLKNLDTIVKTLKETTEIKTFSKVIEEKVYVEFSSKGDIAYLRATDSAYTQVNPINKNLLIGNYPGYTYSNEVVMEYQLANRLAIPVGSDQDYAMMFMPKAGTGIISKEEDIFNKKEIFITGIFPGNDQLNNYIIAPIELAQQLLNLPKNSAYQIVIKLKNPDQTDEVKAKLLSKLGSSVKITTKQEENAAFWKMINTEKIFIYLIFALVIFITTFNLAGAITILQLDKKEQARALLSFGMSLRELRLTYFYTGILIIVTGVSAGLLLGTAICLVQIQTEIFQAGENFPYPVRILAKNYLIVTATASFFSVIIAWLFSKINKKNITEK